MAKRIKIEKLQPGDIILTASHTKAGKAIRLATGGTVSHAMICVQCQYAFKIDPLCALNFDPPLGCFYRA